AGEGPWYGPSFGPPPEVVGDIKVRLLKGEKPQMETQIRMKEEDEDWSEPTKFELEEGVEEKPMPKPDLSSSDRIWQHTLAASGIGVPLGSLKGQAAVGSRTCTQRRICRASSDRVCVCVCVCVCV
ncbi:unnamed protein product, partial [Effrenium voratum]